MWLWPRIQLFLCDCRKDDCAFFHTWMQRFGRYITSCHQLYHKWKPRHGFGASGDQRYSRSLSMSNSQRGKWKNSSASHLCPHFIIYIIYCVLYGFHHYCNLHMQELNFIAIYLHIKFFGEFNWISIQHLSVTLLTYFKLPVSK